MKERQGEERKLGDLLYPDFKENIHLVNDGKRTANSGGQAKGIRKCLKCGRPFPSMHKQNRICSKCTLKQERRSFGILGEELL